MSGYCKLPTSPLHKELIQKSGNSEWANEFYMFTQTTAFKKLFSDKLIYDKNGEPTIESLMLIFDLDKVSSEEKIMQRLEEGLNYNLPQYNYQVVQRVVDFNRNNTLYYATVSDINKQQSKITIHKRISESESIISNIESNLNTFKAIDKFLKKIGISVSILDPMYFNGESGLIVPSNLNNVSGGFFGVINVANNLEGFNVLTEEFSHFIIECCKDNPIIQRCEKYLSEHIELCEEILGDEFNAVKQYYSSKGKPELLFREVLGRILMTEIDENLFSDTSLMRRGSVVYKNFLNSQFQLNTDDKIFAYNEIKTALSNIAYDFVSNTRNVNQTLEQFKKNGDVLAHTSVTIQKNLHSVEQLLLSNVDKYIKIYDKRDITLSNKLKEIFGSKEKIKNIKSGWINEFKTFIVENNIPIENEELMDVCNEYATLTYLNSVLAQTAESFNQIYNDFDNFALSLENEFDFEKITKSATIIKSLKDYSLIYKEQLKTLRLVLRDIKQKNNLTIEKYNIVYENLLSNVDILTNKIINAENSLAEISEKIVTNFCMPFFNAEGNDKIVIAGTSISKEQVISLTHVLHYIDGDISGLKKLLDTGYNSSDLLTQIISTAIKAQQEKIRLQTIDDITKLNALAEQYGIRDTSIFYEKDETGQWTGYHVNRFGIDYAKFKKCKQEDMAAIELDENLNADQRIAMKRQWYKDNTTTIYIDNYVLNNNTGLYEKDTNSLHKIAVTVPVKNSRWSSNAYDKLSDAEKRLCDQLLDYKHKFDCINGRTNSDQYFKCIQKMITTAVEATMSPKNTFRHFIANKFKFTQEDLEFGYVDSETEKQTLNESDRFFKTLRNKIRRMLSNDDVVVETKKTLTTFENKIYHRVPLAFVNNIADLNMLSTNFFDSLLSYTAASYHHAGMNAIADVAELTLEIANNRDILVYDSNNRQLVSLQDDVTVPITKSSVGSNVNEQLEYIIRSQIYSKYKDPGITLFNGNLSVAKLTDGILRLGAISMLGYNPYTAINNMFVGKSQMFIEGLFGEENYNVDDLKNGIQEYHKLLFNGGLAELNAISKDSKLYLLNKLFDPEKNLIQEEVNKGVYRPNTLRFLEKIGPSFMMTAGEQNLKYTGLIAMLYHTKMIDDKNKETNLYDALEVVDVNNNGSVIKQLKIKNGYRKPDGTEFTLYAKNGRSDLQKFKDKMTIMNHKMHGIYDRDDYIMAKKTEIGRILMMFRNFMFPFIQKRWKGSIKKDSTYNIQLGTTDDGMYITAFKFLKQLIFPNTEFITEDGNIKERYKMIFNGLNQQEKSNLIRTFTELLTTFFVGLLLLLCFRDWDDDEGNYSLRFANYFLRRLMTELTYAISPGSLLEILQSPTPIMGPINDLLRVIKSIGDDHVLQSGPYKGMTRFKANVLRAMPIIPNIKDFLNMDTEDKRFKIFEDSFFYKNSKESEQQEEI